MDSQLYLIPFLELQRAIVAFAPANLRVILYRRFMVRIAERIAAKERAQALLTGDSLGQVASQTMENIRTISAATKLPVFRPLIGDDKEDIIKTARRIGSYPISIVPDQDCCSLFIPRHPETMATIEQAEKAEQALDITGLVESCLQSATQENIGPNFFRR
jgi:thiamine biosynthesis protein ThiI